MNLKDFIVNSARLFPDKTAVVFKDRHITYEEFYKNACTCGSALRSLGVGAGDCVCIAARNCVEYLEVLFGCSMIGAVPSLINWRLSAEVMADMIDETGSKVLVISNTEAAKAACLNNKIKVITVCEDSALPYDYDSVLKSGSPELDFAEVNDSDTGLILFTSGTTGRAKGVLIPNKALITQVYNTVVCARWSHEERFMCVSPICHSISLSVIATFCVGGTLILCPLEYLKEYGRMFDILETENVTRTTLVPTVIERIVSYAEDMGIKNSTLSIISYGASPMSSQLLMRCKKVFNCNFHQGYGMTEAYGTIVALLPEDHEHPERLNSVGRPMAGVSLRITDEHNNDVPLGQTGEILVKAETLMTGYLGRPELTEKVLVDGWYHTGDIGYMDKAGYLFLTDRKNDMIITGGENVFPAEIERCIMGMAPDIRAVSVAGVPDSVWGEIIVAAVVKRPDAAISETDVMNYCRDRLGSFKKPKKLMFVDALPVTDSGKVSRAKVKALFQ